jgi:hypothetical protein
MNNEGFNRIIRTVILSLCTCFLISFPAYPETEKPLIFPIPQEMQLTSESFRVDDSVSVIVPSEANENDMFLARFLVRELSDKYSIAVKIEKSSVIPSGKRVIIMGSSRNRLIKEFCKTEDISLDSKRPGAEGYYLHVGGDRIIVAGFDDAGAFYGLQSLRQLLNAGNGKTVKGMKVTDWPAFPFRGIRLYVPGPDNFVFFRRFMRDFMALYKYNKVIIEFNCMRLDRHPEANAGWIEFAKYMQYTRSNSTRGIRGETKNSSHYDAGDGLIIEKSDVKEMVDFARENFLEVIPEIPSLTHGYYLLTKHPELAEYPGDIWPDTYCPSNPGSYKLMFDVYDEYIEVIKPKMIHIGHDEWWGAPLGVCPLCRGKDFSELFAGDINRIYDYMKGKGIKVAMWGDYLLESVRQKGPQNRTTPSGIKYQTPGGLRPEVVRQSIPKDILVLNWFWSREDKEKELQDFGFKQIYGNFTPNISNWKERTKKFDLQGGAPSSWAATNEFNFGKDLIVDFIGCANYLWSTHIIDQKDLPGIVAGRMPSVRSYLSLGRIPSEDGDKVDPVDISQNFNLAVKPGVFNLDFSSLKTGNIENGEKVFMLAPGKTSSRLVAAGTIGKGENTLPSEVKSIQVNEDVSSLIFLHACALPSDNQKAYFNIPDFFDTADLLGWYEIVYEDGFTINVPVQYGVNILEWNAGDESRLDKREGDTGSAQNVCAYLADPVVCSSGGTRVTFYSFEWLNPRFGKKIKEVSLHGTVNNMATLTDYGKPSYAPLKSNAIILAALSKVKKREVMRSSGVQKN